MQIRNILKSLHVNIASTFFVLWLSKSALLLVIRPLIVLRKLAFRKIFNGSLIRFYINYNRENFAPKAKEKENC